MTTTNADDLAIWKQVKQEEFPNCWSKRRPGNFCIPYSPHRQTGKLWQIIITRPFIRPRGDLQWRLHSISFISGHFPPPPFPLIAVGLWWSFPGCSFFFILEKATLASISQSSSLLSLKTPWISQHERWLVPGSRSDRPGGTIAQAYRKVGET